MMIKAESYKIFSEIYCPIVPAPLELFSGDGCRSEHKIIQKKREKKRRDNQIRQSIFSAVSNTLESSLLY